MDKKNDDDIPVLCRKEQQRHFGIDCGNEVLFAAGCWAPGGEHLKKLTVKNTSNKTIKFKYQLPRTKYFSMEFPTVITLSPGMQRSLDISFRPVKYEEYEDFIILQVHIIDGGVKAISSKFRIPVNARTSSLRIILPSGVDFGFCPTVETTQRVFQLKNSGQIDAEYSWTVPGAGEHGHPFSISPCSGTVIAGEEINLTVSFVPLSASVFVSTAVCHVKGRDNSKHLERAVKFSGIGKYAYVCTSESIIDFEETMVGSSGTDNQLNEREFVLKNRSHVRTSFEIINVENDEEPVFFFSPLHGVIEPESFIPIKVKFVPLSTGTFSCDNFDFRTPGGNTVRVTCKGKAIGPILSIWKKNLASNLIIGNSINFHDVEIGKISSRVLVLKNHSQVPVYFNFICTKNGVFALDKVNGIVPPMLEAAVTVSFSPMLPGNFYRRFFCLVQNQSSLYVDVLGTSYDSKNRPSPFQQAHVDAYRLRCEKGIGMLSPEGLEQYMNDHGDSLFLPGMIRLLDNSDKGSDDHKRSRPKPKMLTRSGEAYIEDIQVCHEFFIDSDLKSGAVFSHDTVIDFASSSTFQMSEKKLLRVTNNTKGKVVCSWRVSSTLCKDNDLVKYFEVFPESLDIGAGKTVEFKVTFRPLLENSYYFAELEAYVYFKSNRTFRLVNVDTFTPPWCLIVHALGNTFTSTSAQFLPKVHFSLSKNLMPFPACHVGDCVFQTVLMENASDTPAQFFFLKDPLKYFCCKPRCGLVPANTFQLIQIRFTPRTSKHYSHALKCIVNNAVKDPLIINLRGTGCQPKLSFGSSCVSKDSDIYIKPTSIGLVSTRKFHIKNITRVPLVYRWDVPPSISDIFDLTPRVQLLRGNESNEVMCIFKPKKEKKYSHRMEICIKSINAGITADFDSETLSLPVLQQSSLKMTGVGTVGAISFEPEFIDFPTILVNAKAEESFSIVNSSDCELKYHLKVKLNDETKLHDPESNSDPYDKSSIVSFITFSSSSGVIPARSRQEVTGTFSPSISGEFTFDMECRIQVLDALNRHTFCSPTHASLSMRQHSDQNLKCVMHAKASFPTLVIQDIRSEKVPSSILWEQHSINKMNKFLSTPLTKLELQRNHETTLDINSLKAFTIRFTPNTIGSTREVIYFRVHNPGSLVVEFSIRFPNEADIEVESWADTGEPSNEELRQNLIIDNNIFQVFPRKGTLQPNDSLLCEISYSYISQEYGGIHSLPIIIQVLKGKQMVFDMQGQTLKPTEPFAFFPCPRFKFSPVMIGEDQAPIQQIQLFNTGDSLIEYKVDLEKIETFNNENYKFPIFECTNPCGTISPHSSTYMDWKFCPLEEKDYSLACTLTSHGFLEDSSIHEASFSISARGYNPRKESFQDVRNKEIVYHPPKKQILMQPKQSAIFNIDRLSFLHVPMHSENSQLLVLKNISQTDGTGTNINFTWDSNHPLVSCGVVSFHPSKGVIELDSHVVVRVTVCASNKAMIIDHDIACFLQQVFQTDLRNSFVDSEATSDLNSSRTSVVSRCTTSSKRFFAQNQALRSPDSKGMSKISSSNSTAASYLSGEFNTNSKLETRSDFSMSQRSTRRGSARHNSLNSQSENVQHLGALVPLHVHIFAQVLSKENYRKIYPHNMYERMPVFVTENQNPASNYDNLSTMNSFDQKLAKKYDRCTIETIFDQVVRELVCSADVLQEMKNLPEKRKTPYFTQFRGIEQTKECDNEILTKLKKQMNDHHFQAQTGKILENTVFNLIQEALHGEYAPADAP